MKQVWLTESAPLDGLDRKHKNAGGSFNLVGISETGNGLINTEPETTGIISFIPMKCVLQEVDLLSTNGLSPMMKAHFLFGKPVYQQGLPRQDGTVILRDGTNEDALVNIVSSQQVIELDSQKRQNPECLRALTRLRQIKKTEKSPEQVFGDAVFFRSAEDKKAEQAFADAILFLSSGGSQMNR